MGTLVLPVDSEVLEERARLRRFVAPLVAALTSSYTAGSAMGMLLQLYLRSLGTPHILIALGTSARSLGSVLGGVVLGGLAGRYPHKPLLMASMALGAGGLAGLILLPPRPSPSGRGSPGRSPGRGSPPWPWPSFPG
ncbi:hypothetical protein ACVNPS_07445 [Candidatus Bipolaricaulota sp. J31]